jgi:SPX domain protein involved in polyphosphate accumulation
MRYERKFIIPYGKKNLLNYFLKIHPLHIKKLYDNRKINNIYFDNINFKFFKENLDGVSDRVKIRVRWYGKTFGEIKNSKLEFKIRENNLGKKILFDMDNFLIQSTKGINKKTFNNKVQSEIIQTYLNLNYLKPKILNIYERSYFITQNQKFRITLDSFPDYYDLDKQTSHIRKLNHFQKYQILEIKYDEKNNKEFQFFMKYLPLRLDKNSKYVFGIHKILDNKII